MAGPRRTYTATCSGCGRTRTTDAAYRARLMNAGQAVCLSCVRRGTGWQHKPGCTDPDDWDHSPCPVAPEGQP